jgi:hypothetical protein
MPETMNSSREYQTKRKEKIMKHTRLTQTFIAAMTAAAIASTAYASLASHTLHLQYAVAVLAIAAVTSRMKVKLPGVDGNMSVNLPFLLVAVVSLSAAEAVLIACISTLVQCWPKRDAKFKPEQMLFNVSMMAFAAGMAHLTWHAGSQTRMSEPLMLALTTAVFFFGQTAPVATVITLAKAGSTDSTWHRTWLTISEMSFPYFVLSAGVTSMMSTVSHVFGWQTAVILFPLMYVIHRSYRLYFGTTAQTESAPAMSRAARAGA